MQPRPKGQKLQSNSSDVGDIEVVCIKHPATFGRKKRGKLPTLASDDAEYDTETLGVAGGKESRDETRDVGKTNTVFGELGYQDGFR